MRKTRILRIIARLNVGGPAIHVILLTEGLDKSKFYSVLVCGKIGKSEGDMAYYALERNIKPQFIFELKREPNLFNDILAFMKIYRIIKTEQPDIIHTHTAKAGAVGRLAGIVYNFLHPYKQIKIFHTFHGHIFDGYFGRFKTRVFILIEQLLALFSSKIIAVSESVKKELISLGIGNNDKIGIIPLGFELDKFLKIPLKSNPVINIGIVGRLVPIKNHRLFLEVATKVSKDNPGSEFRFKIIGDGELRDELEEYAHKLNIHTEVDFLGWQRDMVGVYSDLDIVVLTSINEGTPVSLIEAMASGRVVVATDVGGVKDILGNETAADIEQDKNFKVLERGLIVKPQDSDSFAAALSFILQHGYLRNNMCMLARDFVKDRFSKERLVKDIESLYDKSP